MLAYKTLVSDPVIATEPDNKPLEIVVPFTSPELTQAALDEADKLIGQLDGRIRVITVRTVPIAFPLDRPHISADYLEAAIRKLLSRTPARGEIYLVRDPGQTWKSLLPSRSLIVVASRRRPWRTQEESLARLLRRNGHEVLLIHPR